MVRTLRSHTTIHSDDDSERDQSLSLTTLSPAAIQPNGSDSMTLIPAGAINVCKRMHSVLNTTWPKKRVQEDAHDPTDNPSSGNPNLTVVERLLRECPISFVPAIISGISC